MMPAAIGKDCLAGQVCTPGCTPKAKRAPHKTCGGLAAPTPSAPHRMHEKVRVQFWKTEPCRFYPKCRKGEACPFVHNQDELKFRPDLNKTSLCHDWERGICLLRASECNFAHGYSDMKQTMPLGKSPLKAKIKDPTPLRGEATSASLQAEQIPHNLFGNELDALQRQHADMKRLSNLLNRQIQDIEREVLKLSAGLADAHPIGSCETTMLSKMVAEVQPACTSVCLGKVESMLAEPELQIALLLPLRPLKYPPVHSDMIHPKEAAAAEVNSQVGMVSMLVPMLLPAGSEMCPNYLAHMLTSAVPDHYED